MRTTDIVILILAGLAISAIVAVLIIEIIRKKHKENMSIYGPCNNYSSDPNCPSGTISGPCCKGTKCFGGVSGQVCVDPSNPFLCYDLFAGPCVSQDGTLDQECADYCVQSSQSLQ